MLNTRLCSTQKLRRRLHHLLPILPANTLTSATTEMVFLYVYNMMKMVIHDFLMEQHHSLTNLFVTWQITFKKQYVSEKRLSAQGDIC